MMNDTDKQEVREMIAEVLTGTYQVSLGLARIGMIVDGVPKPTPPEPKPKMVERRVVKFTQIEKKSGQPTSDEWVEAPNGSIYRGPTAVKGRIFGRIVYTIKVPAEEHGHE